MGKKALVLQVISYLALALFEGFIVVGIIGGDADFFTDNIITILIIGVVWAVFASILLFRKKAIASKNAEVKGETVTIAKADYEALLFKIEELEKKLAEKE